MLSKSDDLPIHQTPEPIAHPSTTDRNFYDRYWFNGFSDDGGFYFGIALALYPNRRVMDAAFSLVIDGVQHAFHASRLAPRERTETRVGPFSIEVADAMKVIRVRIEPNETGIECDLTFRARTCAIEETRSTLRRDDRVIMDSTRFTQFGRWQGGIRVGSTSVDVAPERVYATRDRSWGVRPVGEPEAGAPGGLPEIFFVWSPLHFDDFCTHFAIFEDRTGTPWHATGVRVPTYATPEELPGVEDPAAERMASIAHRLTFEKGTRRVAAAELDLVGRGGERLVVSLEPILRFPMFGIGYGHPDWTHGVYKGENALAGESWKLSDLDPGAIHNQHVQQVVRARLGDREGMGVLEQLIFGPYERYGFKELLDGAT